MIQLTARTILSHLASRISNSPLTGGIILLSMPLWLGQGSLSKPVAQAESWRELIALAGRAAQNQRALELYPLLHKQSQRRLHDLSSHWQQMSPRERLRAFWDLEGIQPSFAENGSQDLPAPTQWAQVAQIQGTFLLHLYLQRRPNIFSQLYQRRERQGCRIYPTKRQNLLIYHCFSFSPLRLVQGSDGHWRLGVRHFYHK